MERFIRKLFGLTFSALLAVVLLVGCISNNLGDEKSSLYLLPNFTYQFALAKYYTEAESKESKEKSEKTLVVEEMN